LCGWGRFENDQVFLTGCQSSHKLATAHNAIR
jgi:hypothetical protein